MHGNMIFNNVRRNTNMACKCKGRSKVEREVWSVEITGSGGSLPTTIEVGVR
jgi:hypothetical protein